MNGLKEENQRVVFSSSMFVYGKVANNVQEEKICNLQSIYGLSKFYSEKLFQRLKDNKIKVKFLDYSIYMD